LGFFINIFFHFGEDAGEEAVDHAVRNYSWRMLLGDLLAETLKGFERGIGNYELAMPRKESSGGSHTSSP